MVEREEVAGRIAEVQGFIEQQIEQVRIEKDSAISGLSYEKSNTARNDEMFLMNLQSLLQIISGEKVETKMCLPSGRWIDFAKVSPASSSNAVDTKELPKFPPL